MRGTVCDICKKLVTEDSYQFKLKRKYFAALYDGGVVYPDKTTVNEKIEMCGSCYKKFVDFCNKE